jgi:hypothetical protein
VRLGKVGPERLGAFSDGVIEILVVALLYFLPEAVKRMAR